MTYQSTSRYLPRESVYPSPQSGNYLSALEDCVQATEACSRTLGAGLGKFEPGVRDLPRLTKVFKHKHHFLVLPEPAITAHKSALSQTLAPQIDTLINKAEIMVESEKVKVANMEERLSILKSGSRPNSQSNYSGGQSAVDLAKPSLSEGTESKISNLNMKDLSILQRKKVMQLKAKRDRLEKEMARLSAQ